MIFSNERGVIAALVPQPLWDRDLRARKTTFTNWHEDTEDFVERVALVGVHADANGQPASEH